MKQTSSFQRWKRRYFKLKGNKLYYAKDTKVSVMSCISVERRRRGDEYFPTNFAPFPFKNYACGECVVVAHSHRY